MLESSVLDAPVSAPSLLVNSYMLTLRARMAAPKLFIDSGKYIIRLARTTSEIREALRLRFSVFNLELAEGLAESWRTGYDEDEFDATSHHLLAIEKASGAVIGTYRLRTSEIAANGGGFYTAREFALTQFPAHILAQSVELGRACIALPYRNTRVLLLLWRGLATYLLARRKRYFFGCCSLTSQDPREGWNAWRLLQKGGHLHPAVCVPPRAGWECPAEYGEEDFALPKLFQAYLRFGVKVCSPPVLDREFKTIDFLVLFDSYALDEQARRTIFLNQSNMSQ